MNINEPRITLTSDGAHITSPETAEKIEKKNLSASLITGLNSCSVRWLADSFVIRDIVEEEPDNAARRGSLFHKIMEDFFIYPPAERTTSLLKKIVKEVLVSEEFIDLSRSPEAVAWLKDAINGYYSMGGRPQQVEIAEITLHGKTKPGLETFVKGKIGDTERDILGFVDRIVVDQKKDDGSVIVEDWKGLALDTLLPTPTGWTTMGEVSEGDELLGSDGNITKVLKKSDVHNRPCYKISFDSGETVTCDNVHLWQISINDNDITDDNYDIVVDTDNLYKMFEKNRALAIRNVAPVTAFKKKRLAIPPYLLGVWLGNGSDNNELYYSDKKTALEVKTVLQKEWCSKIRVKKSGEKGYSLIIRDRKENCCNNNCKHTSLGNNEKCQNCVKSFQNSIDSHSFNDLIAGYGLSDDKRVPMIYLRGSMKQRVELLQGLMDVCGYWNSVDQTVGFKSDNVKLVEAVVEIVSSLGVNAYVKTGAENEVVFTPVGFKAFRQKEVEEVASLNDTGKALYHHIVNIEPVTSVPTQCIAVDSDDSLYLFGLSMVPTHNTGKAKVWNPKTKSEEGLPEQRQQLIYKMLLEKEGINVSGARLIYPVAKQIVNVDFEDKKLAERVVEDVENTDQALSTMIDNNAFEYGPSFLCAWCPLSKMCPAATIKPYEKMQKAFASQPEPEILMKGIALG